MKKYIKIPTEVIVKMNLREGWQITPFLSATFDQQSLDDVTWSDDGKTGVLSYEEPDIREGHTYTYLTKTETRQFTTAKVSSTPSFYDAKTMELTK